MCVRLARRLRGLPRATGGDQSLTYGHCKDPPRTGRCNIEGRRIRGAQARLQLAGRRGEPAVGGDGAEDDGVQLVRGEVSGGAQAGQRHNRSGAHARSTASRSANSAPM